MLYRIAPNLTAVLIKYAEPKEQVAGVLTKEMEKLRNFSSGAGALSALSMFDVPQAVRDVLTKRITAATEAAQKLSQKDPEAAKKMLLDAYKRAVISTGRYAWRKEFPLWYMFGNPVPWLGLGGALAGGGLGLVMSDKEKAKRNALLGALIGGAGGTAAGFLLDRAII